MIYKCLLLISIVWLCGCSSSSRLIPGTVRLVETRGSQEIKSRAGGGYYVGVSRESIDEQSARDDAAFHARKQIINSLEIEISTETIERILINGSTARILTGQVYQDIKTEAVAKNILKVKPEAWCIERWQRIGETNVTYFYRVWCLIQYSRDSHNRMVAEIVDSFLNSAEPRFRDAQGYRNEGKIRESLRRARQIREMSKEVEGYRGISPTLLSKVKEILLRTESLIGDISILVAIKETVKGEISSDGIVEARLSDCLSSEDTFAIKSSLDWMGINPQDILQSRDLQMGIAQREGVDLVLIGSASVDQISEMHEGIFVARMNMHLKLVEGATGSVLWETSIPGPLVNDSRGFANNSREAARRALSLADQTDIHPTPFERISKSILGTFD